MKTNQKGAIPLLILITIVGVLAFILVANFASFKNKFFAGLYPKKSSLATTGVEFIDQNGDPINQTNTKQVSARLHYVPPAISGKAAITVPDENLQSSNTSYDLGVAVIKYFPLTADKQKINKDVTTYVGDPLNTIRDRTDKITKSLQNFIPIATHNSIKYHTVFNKEVDEALPTTAKYGDPIYADYKSVLSSVNICDLVDKQGVNEVWLYAYQGDKLHISESRMSSQFGEVSNSQRYNNTSQPDLPVCNHSYVVLTFNYLLGADQAMHNWSHQIETELNEINHHLFWDLWVGPTPAGKGGSEAGTARCGWAHDPPNARGDYDYQNKVANLSDCENWNPDRPVDGSGHVDCSNGSCTNISCTNWGCTDKADSYYESSQLDYLVWMWQHLPGPKNSIKFKNQQLRNWWDIHGDWDNVMKNPNTQKRLTLPDKSAKVLAAVAQASNCFTDSNGNQVCIDSQPASTPSCPTTLDQYCIGGGTDYKCSHIMQCDGTEGYGANCFHDPSCSSTPPPTPTPTPTSTPESTPPPPTECAHISCQVPHDQIGCTYPNAVTDSCDPSVTLTCGDLVCPSSSPMPVESIVPIESISPTQQPTVFRVAWSLDDLASAVTYPFTSNDMVISAFLPTGNGQHTYYVQYGVNGVWGDPVSVIIIDFTPPPPTPEPNVQHASPTPAPVSNCTTGIACAGACQAPSNSCSDGNGTAGNCQYTQPSYCNPVSAPDQHCSTNTCQNGFACSNHNCVSTGINESNNNSAASNQAIANAIPEIQPTPTPNVVQQFVNNIISSPKPEESIVEQIASQSQYQTTTPVTHTELITTRGSVPIQQQVLAAEATPVPTASSNNSNNNSLPVIGGLMNLTQIIYNVLPNSNSSQIPTKSFTSPPPPPQAPRENQTSQINQPRVDLPSVPPNVKQKPLVRVTAPPLEKLIKTSPTPVPAPANQGVIGSIVSFTKTLLAVLFGKIN